MAVWWLDLVRYADTVGYHGDQEHAIAPYRDWVLKAFRDDCPFDRFTREQLAGDLLPDRTTEQLVASAYNRVLQTTHEGGAQPGEYLAKYAADRVRNVGAVWLGATLGCAECHDHKFDPFTQRDFYRMAAFFADIDEAKGFAAKNTSPTDRPPEMDVVSPLAADDGVKPLRVMVTVAIEPRPTRVLRRGDWMDTGGEPVEPGVPECLPALPDLGRRATRLDLAEWLCRDNRALTARVVANRIWALFFGRGLSASLDDQGVQGAWPSHPELLNWLAAELVDSGWSVRQLIRTIVTSRAYRQSSVLRRTSVRVPAARRVRSRDRRHPAVHGQDRRPHLRDPLDANRPDQPRPGAHRHEHRHVDLRPAEHGLVGAVRTRQRDARSARLRRADQRRRPRPPADRIAPVERRVPAGPAAGRRVPVEGRSGPLRAEPGRRVAGTNLERSRRSVLERA
jgi:hypothetical protein